VGAAFAVDTVRLCVRRGFRFRRCHSRRRRPRSQDQASVTSTPDSPPWPLAQLGVGDPPSPADHDVAPPPPPPPPPQPLALSAQARSASHDSNMPSSMASSHGSLAAVAPAPADHDVVAPPPPLALSAQARSASSMASSYGSLAAVAPPVLPPLTYDALPGPTRPQWLAVGAAPAPATAAVIAAAPAGEAAPAPWFGYGTLNHPPVALAFDLDAHLPRDAAPAAVPTNDNVLRAEPAPAVVVAVASPAAAPAAAPDPLFPPPPPAVAPAPVPTPAGTMPPRINTSMDLAGQQAGADRVLEMLRELDEHPELLQPSAPPLNNLHDGAFTIEDPDVVRCRHTHAALLACSFFAHLARLGGLWGGQLAMEAWMNGQEAPSPARPMPVSAGASSISASSERPLLSPGMPARAFLGAAPASNAVPRTAGGRAMRPPPAYTPSAYEMDVLAGDLEPWQIEELERQRREAADQQLASALQREEVSAARDDDEVAAEQVRVRPRAHPGGRWRTDAVSSQENDGCLRRRGKHWPIATVLLFLAISGVFAYSLVLNNILYQKVGAPTRPRNGGPHADGSHTNTDAANPSGPPGAGDWAGAHDSGVAGRAVPALRQGPPQRQPELLRRHGPQPVSPGTPRCRQQGTRAHGLTGSVRPLAPQQTYVFPNGSAYVCGDIETFCGMGGFRVCVNAAAFVCVYGWVGGCGPRGGHPDRFWLGARAQTGGNPDQWWRFFTGIFIQSGVIQYVTIAIVVLRIGLGLDRDHGSLRLLVVFVVAGVLGFGVAMMFSTLQSMWAPPGVLGIAAH
jgi:hypothetical protein